MISILLAVYNGEKFLKKSIDSVLNQTFSEFELLIGFNGTIDKSKDIVASYNDKRIKVYDYGSDKGKSKTLNKLTKETKYDFLAIQDDDDVWTPFKLSQQVYMLTEYDVVGSYINYIDENDQYIGHPSLASLHTNIVNLCLLGINQIANSTAIFAKKDLLEVGGWSEALDMLEDFDLWLKLIKKGKMFHNVPIATVNHRLHKSSNFNNRPNQDVLIKELLHDQKNC